MNYSQIYTKSETSFLRHAIFRSLVMLLRGEHFDKDKKPLSHAAKVILYIPEDPLLAECDDDELYELGICSVPNKLVNLIACERLARVYGDLLYICGCFYRLESGVWVLDVSDQLARRGVLIPIRSNGLIVGMNVYRHLNDGNPFLLRVRVREEKIHERD